MAAINPITSLPYTPGEQNILGMINSCEAASTKWADFFITLVRTTSKAVTTMPPHNITITHDKADKTYSVSVRGPDWNVVYDGAKSWA